MNRQFWLGILVVSLTMNVSQGQEPRPTVVELQAWVSPPAFFPRQPNGAPYRKPQVRGDLYAIPGSTASVWIRTDKPIKNAVIEILGCPIDTDDSEIVLRRVPLKVTKAREAEGAFALEPFESEKKIKYELTRYRIVVTDETGRRNVPSLRRTIALRPEEPPNVRLLRDILGEEADIDISGMPVPLGERVRISYLCGAPHGMSKAALLYRVLKQGTGKAAREMEPWVTLALMEVVAAKDSGPFNPMTGVFFNSKLDDQVPFHAVPSPIFNDEPGRTIGGGRVILDLKGLVDSRGKIVMLRAGDQIEYYIEVLGRTREPTSAIPVGRSETRIVNVVTIEEFLRWVQEAQREADRIRKLEQRQKGVFERK